MPYIDKTDHFKRPRDPQPQSEKRELRQYLYHTRRWRKLRASYLNDHPLCERCLADDRIVPAVDVHHKETFTGKGELWQAYAYDYRNLMAVCKRCHGIIHKEEEDGHEQ